MIEWRCTWDVDGVCNLAIGVLAGLTDVEEVQLCLGAGDQALELGNGDDRVARGG